MQHTRLNILAFIIGLAGLVAGWWPTLAHMTNLIWTVDVFAHGQIIPIVSLVLIWSRRKGLAALTHFDKRAVIIMLAATLLWLVGQFMDAALLGHVAFVSLFQGLVLLCFGPLVYRRLLFPLLFLYLAIPFGYAIVGPLQITTARAVIWLLGLLGIEHTADGVLIQLSSGLYEVAQACAGVKFLFTSMVTGVLLAHLVFNSWRRRIMIVLVGLTLPIIANILRVLTILLIAEVTDQSFARGIDHIVYGWVFLSIVLFALIAFAYWVSDKPLELQSEEGISSVKATRPKASGPALAFVLLAALALVPVSVLMAPTQAPAPNGESLLPSALFDAPLEGFRLLEGARMPAAPSFSNADQLAVGFVRRNARVIAVYRAGYHTLQPGKRLFQIENRLVPAEWKQVPGQSRRIPDVCGFSVSENWYEHDGQVVMVWSLRFADEHAAASSVREKLYTTQQNLLGQTPAGQIIVITAPVFDLNPESDTLKTMRSDYRLLMQATLEKTFKEGGLSCAV